ncbi:hypothetical protein D3C74_478330 [compost metagenome]
MYVDIRIFLDLFPNQTHVHAVQIQNDNQFLDLVTLAKIILQDVIQKLWTVSANNDGNTQRCTISRHNIPSFSLFPVILCV